MKGLKDRPSHFSAAQGEVETRRESYDSYDNRALETSTLRSAKSISGVSGSAWQQRNVVRRSGGYTIIEVMMFLTITGALLASALAVFRGQQQKTQFTQGIRETETRLRTTMNEVASGYFPNSGSFTCRSLGTSIQFDTPDSDQGTNADCIFLGKIVQFGANDDCVPDNSDTDCFNYDVHTLAGMRKLPGGQEAETLQQTARTMVIRDVDNQPLNFTEEFDLGGGLTVTRVMVKKGETFTPVGAIGFVNTLATYGGGGGDPVSGSQNVSLVSVPGSELGQTANELNSQMINLTEAQRNPDSITLCLEEAGGGRVAALVIGGSGRQLNIDTLIDNQPKECTL